MCAVVPAKEDQKASGSTALTSLYDWETVNAYFSRRYVDVVARVLQISWIVGTFALTKSIGFVGDVITVSPTSTGPAGSSSSVKDEVKPIHREICDLLVLLGPCFIKASLSATPVDPSSAGPALRRPTAPCMPFAPR